MEGSSCRSGQQAWRGRARPGMAMVMLQGHMRGGGRCCDWSGASKAAVSMARALGDVASCREGLVWSVSVLFAGKPLRKVCTSAACISWWHSSSGGSQQTFDGLQLWSRKIHTVNCASQRLPQSGASRSVAAAQHPAAGQLRGARTLLQVIDSSIVNNGS